MDVSVSAVIVTRVETGRDKGNRPVYSEQRSSPIGVTVWPKGFAENVNAEDISTDLLDSSWPTGTVIPTNAQVEIPLGTYQVQGNGFDWGANGFEDSFAEWTPGVIISLKRVS